MKKLLFLLAFTFIGEQVFSQMYIVTLSSAHSSHIGANGIAQPILSIIDPNGMITYIPLGSRNIYYNSDVLAIINLELNNIINQGYKLIETNNGASDNNGLIDAAELNYGTAWYFSIP